MFEYLSELERELIKPLTLESIIDCIESPRVDFIKPILSNHSENIWKDLCEYHFGELPLPDQNAEVFFRFNAFAQLSEQALKDRKNDLVVEYVEMAAEKYSAPGHILCLFMYKELAEVACVEIEKEAFNKRAYCHLTLLEQTYFSSSAALKDTGWGEAMIEAHGSIDEFIKFERNQFEGVSREKELETAEFCQPAGVGFSNR